MKELPYKEGDWFAVPLEAGGFAVGHIARMTRKGAMLGYFFGPRRNSIPSKKELTDYSSRDAVAIYRFGDLHLLEKKWPIIDHTQQLDRKDWPMPVFVRTEPSVLGYPARYWQVIHSEDDPIEVVSEKQISYEEARNLPPDSLYGAGAVESALDRLL